jgi:hypothetical protein
MASEKTTINLTEMKDLYIEDYKTPKTPEYGNTSNVRGLAELIL